eukprot:scaffold867_cov317-Pavlova_lutheri.AAC.62
MNVLPSAVYTVQSFASLSNFASVTSAPSTRFTPAACAVRARRLSKLILFTAQQAASPSFSLDSPMYETPEGETNPPASAKWASLFSRSCFMTPICSRMRMAGVQTASPQYLSRGKFALSNVHTLAPALAMKNPQTEPEGPDPTMIASNASAGSVSGVRLPFLTLARLLLLIRVTAAGTATAVTATTAHAVTTFLVSACLMLEIHPRTTSIFLDQSFRGPVLSTRHTRSYHVQPGSTRDGAADVSFLSHARPFLRSTRCFVRCCDATCTTRPRGWFPTRLDQCATKGGDPRVVWAAGGRPHATIRTCAFEESTVRNKESSAGKTGTRAVGRGPQDAHPLGADAPRLYPLGSRGERRPGACSCTPWCSCTGGTRVLGIREADPGVLDLQPGSISENVPIKEEIDREDRRFSKGKIHPVQGGESRRWKGRWMPTATMDVPCQCRQDMPTPWWSTGREKKGPRKRQRDEHRLTSTEQALGCAGSGPGREHPTLPRTIG